jgi:DNA invertase Pin-like site-specific DNA recombinase
MCNLLAYSQCNALLLSMPNEPRIGVYLRVSTDTQDTGLQKTEIENLIRTRGFNRVITYEDKSSGTNSNRPAYQQLMSDCRAGRIDIVIVWKLDRLFRSLSHLIAVLQEFRESNIDFISIRDQIDITTSAGRLMLHILGAFAEFEASLIRERVKAGLMEARRKGVKLGRPQALDKEKALELRAQGLSLSQIGRCLGAAKSTVSKTLKSTGVTKGTGI